MMVVMAGYVPEGDDDLLVVVAMVMVVVAAEAAVTMMIMTTMTTMTMMMMMERRRRTMAIMNVPSMVVILVMLLLLLLLLMMMMVMITAMMTVMVIVTQTMSMMMPVSRVADFRQTCSTRNYVQLTIPSSKSRRGLSHSPSQRPTLQPPVTTVRYQAPHQDQAMASCCTPTPYPPPHGGLSPANLPGILSRPWPPAVISRRRCRRRRGGVRPTETRFLPRHRWLPVAVGQWWPSGAGRPPWQSVAASRRWRHGNSKQRWRYRVIRRRWLRHVAGRPGLCGSPTPP